MKFFTELVLTALAVTVANADNLRSPQSEGNNDDFGYGPKGSKNQKDVTNDEDNEPYMVNLTDVYGDEVPEEVNILNLIGTGKGQISIEQIMQAFDDDSLAKIEDDLFSPKTSNKDDSTHVKGGTKNYPSYDDNSSTKTKDGDQSDESNDDDLDWLLDEEDTGNKNLGGNGDKYGKGSNTKINNDVNVNGNDVFTKINNDVKVNDDEQFTDFDDAEYAKSEGLTPKTGNNVNVKSNSPSYTMFNEGGNVKSGNYENSQLTKIDNTVNVKGGKGGVSVEEDSELDFDESEDPPNNVNKKGGLTPAGPPSATKMVKESGTSPYKTTTLYESGAGGIVNDEDDDDDEDDDKKDVIGGSKPLPTKPFGSKYSEQMPDQLDPVNQKVSNPPLN